MIVKKQDICVAVGFLQKIPAQGESIVSKEGEKKTKKQILGPSTKNRTQRPKKKKRFSKRKALG